MARIQLRVSEEDYRIIKKMAQKQNKTLSEFVRDCIKEYIQGVARDATLLQTFLKQKDNTEKLIRAFFEYQVAFVDAFFVDKSKAEKLKQILQDKLEEIKAK